MRIATLLALALVGCTTETRVEQKTVPGTAVDHGRALFSDPGASPNSLNDFACSTCHPIGPDASGARAWPGAPLEGVALRPTFWGGHENDLLRSIDDCLVLFMRVQEPWRADDPEAEAMFAWLSSLPKTQPDAAAFTVVASVVDVPPGDAAAGAAVYARACATCHGAIHTGAGRLTATAPKLPDEPNAEHAEYSKDEQRLIFVEKTRHGGFFGYGGVMPPFSEEALSDADLGAVLAYLGQ